MLNPFLHNRLALGSTGLARACTALHSTRHVILAAAVDSPGPALGCT